MTLNLFKIYCYSLYRLIKRSFLLIKPFFLLYFFIPFLIIFLIIHSLWIIKIDQFLNKQNKIFIQHGYQLTFNKSYFTQWHIIPTKTLLYPTIQTINNKQIIQKWQARKLTISYSIIHPLHISITILGNQLFCPSSPTTNCLQSYGKPFHILIPIHNEQKVKFYTSLIFINLSSLSPLHFIQAKKLKGNINWNFNSQIRKYFQSIDIKAQKLSFDSYLTDKQSLNKTQIKFALTPYDASTQLQNYKILLHEAKGYWHSLFFNTNGKIYFLPPTYSPTGELNLYVENIQPILQKQINKLHCCTELKIKLQQSHYPDHIHIPLSLRQGNIYFNTIPLPFNKLASYIKLIPYLSYTK